MKYSASFKLQVVKFASDNSNNSAASRKFGIDEKLVRDWRRKMAFEEKQTNKQTNGSFRSHQI